MATKNFKIDGKRKILIAAGLAFVFVLVFSWWRSDFILDQMGQFLLLEMRPVKSDVIVILRGDRTYVRTLEAARLFRQGYAEHIYISMNLADSDCKKLQTVGVIVQCDQERLKDILMKLGVGGGMIVLGDEDPGGGTQGEANRVRQMMSEQGYKTALIVTSWWHTKRASIIYEKVFYGTGMKAVVVAAQEDKSNPSNWWKYRYDAINVAEEFPKLLIYYLTPSSNLAFSDDPPS